MWSSLMPSTLTLHMLPLQGEGSSNDNCLGIPVSGARGETPTKEREEEPRVLWQGVVSRSPGPWANPPPLWVSCHVNGAIASTPGPGACSEPGQGNVCLRALKTSTACFRSAGGREEGARRNDWEFLIYHREERKLKQPAACEPAKTWARANSCSLAQRSPTSPSGFHVEDSRVGGAFGLCLARPAEPHSSGGMSHLHGELRGSGTAAPKRDGYGGVVDVHASQRQRAVFRMAGPPSLCPTGTPIPLIPQD